jgi:hypothetical protein
LVWLFGINCIKELFEIKRLPNQEQVINLRPVGPRSSRTISSIPLSAISRSSSTSTVISFCSAFAWLLSVFLLVIGVLYGTIILYSSQLPLNELQPLFSAREFEQLLLHDCEML